MRHQIEKMLSGKSVRLSRISAITQKYESNEQPIPNENLETISPLDMALKIYKHQYGEKMPETMLNLLHKTIQGIEK
jgi:exonuclease SbcD